MINKYSIRTYIYMVPPPPKTHTFSQFTAICGILLFFSMLLENVWSDAHVWFFLVFFGHDLEKTKKLKFFLVF